MNKRNRQLIVAAIIFVVALILSYLSTQKTETVIDADIMLVLDISGSMEDEGQYGTKLDDAKKSANDFLRTVEPEFFVGLVTFETKVNLEAPLGLNRTYLKNKIDQMTSGDMTAMGDAMALAVDHLTSEGRDGADKYMVLMTDGRQTSGSLEPSDVLGLAVSEDVLIYTVAFGSNVEDIEVDVLEDIAARTGGQYFYAPSGEELGDHFVRIAEDININVGYYYGSRSLVVAAIFLIIFLPALVETGKVAVDIMKEKFMKV